MVIGILMQNICTLEWNQIETCFFGLFHVIESVASIWIFHSRTGSALLALRFGELRYQPQEADTLSIKLNVVILRHNSWHIFSYFDLLLFEFHSLMFLHTVVFAIWYKSPYVTHVVALYSSVWNHIFTVSRTDNWAWWQADLQRWQGVQWEILCCSTHGRNLQVLLQQQDVNYDTQDCHVHDRYWRGS